MLKRSLLPLLLTLLLLGGCSPKGTKIGMEGADSNGLKIEITSDPDPPIAGANTFTVHLTDDSTGAAVVNANVTISAYNDLAGGGDSESGRSQGDGSYNVPIKLGIPDHYKLDIKVERPSHDDTFAQFSIDAG